MVKFCKVCGKKIDVNHPGKRNLHSSKCATLYRHGECLKYYCTRCCVELTEENYDSYRTHKMCRNCFDKVDDTRRAFRSVGEKPHNLRVLKKTCMKCKTSLDIKQFPVNDDGRRSVYCKWCHEELYKPVTITVKRKIHFKSEGLYPSFDGVVMQHDGENNDKCFKCALYDYPKQCENYDCTGHYIRKANGRGVSIHVIDGSTSC